MSLLCNAFQCTDCSCVNTGSIVISEKTLSTSFVKTCSILSFKFNNKNYLAHVDDHDPTMESRLFESLQNIQEYLKKIEMFYIYKGINCNQNCKSYKIILDVLKKFNITNIKLIDQDILEFRTDTHLK